MNKTIMQLIDDPRVDEVSDERHLGDGFWVYLKVGFKSADDPCGALHTIHESSPTQCLSQVRRALKCDCEDCRMAKK